MGRRTGSGLAGDGWLLTARASMMASGTGLDETLRLLTAREYRVAGSRTRFRVRGSATTVVEESKAGVSAPQTAEASQTHTPIPFRNKHMHKQYTRNCLFQQYVILPRTTAG